MTLPPDRPALKAQAREQLRNAQGLPMKIMALYGALMLLLNVLVDAVEQPELPAVFINVLATLAAWVLEAGLVLYFMDLRRGRPAGLNVLFDGFSFTGKIIALNIVASFFIALWTMLLVIPGFVAAYRYRFALYYLYEDPGMDIMEALRRSCQRTDGWKYRLFCLDLSYVGWNLLARLPLVIAAVMTQEWGGSALHSTFLNTAPAAASLQLPLIVLCGVWDLVVCLFYMPEYYWVNLAYFDLARQGEEAQTP